MSSLLLLHGFTGSPAAWAPVVERLPSTPTVLTPWLAGHGIPPAALDVRDFDGELARLAAEIPADAPALVAGYSLGARLALGLLVRYPERVTGALLVSCNPGLRDPAERAARRSADEAWCTLLEQEGLEAFVERWQDQPLFAFEARLAAPLRAARERERLGHRAQGLAHCLRATGLAAMPSYWDALSTVERPVAVLAGELDARFCELGRELTAALPRASFSAVADAGHNLLLERPEAVARAIVRGLGP